MRFLSLAAVAAAFLTVSGAFSQEPATVEGSAAATGQTPGPNHILASGELIEIKVFQEPDLDTTVRIPENGTISFPLIGEVEIAGRTVQQAAKSIRDRLEARFLVDPHVSLAVLEPIKRLFTILGQVQKPGTYRFPDRQPLNLIHVIGIAGGYTRLADAGRITVKRRVGGKDTVFTLDGKRMASDRESKPFLITPGDIITVRERIF